MEQPIESLVQTVSTVLMQKGIKVVFAESCTGGLISATLARVAGISSVHCGSAVVYRLDTKTHWLGVSASMLIDPGPVSEPVAVAMAEGVLSRTPEAEMAVSITGHLGPNAPVNQDGQVFVGIARRGKPCLVNGQVLRKFSNEFPYPGLTEREQRQWAAVEYVFSLVARLLTEEETH